MVWGPGSIRAQVVITAGNPASNQSACNGKKSVLGNDVQKNMVDSISKDSSNYIYQPPCAAPTCTCMIHVGIFSFGSISVVLHARYERSWAAMMKKRSGRSDQKCNGQANRFFFAKAFSHSRPHLLAAVPDSCQTHFSEQKKPS